MAQDGLGGDSGSGDDDSGLKRGSEDPGEESSPADLKQAGLPWAERTGDELGMSFMSCAAL